MKVILDAGHGGFDEGVVFENRIEKDDNLDLTLAVGKLLEDKGVEVAYTRSNDVYATPLGKAYIANELGGDLLVSFHRNYGIDPTVYSGAESFIYKKGTISEQVAEKINSNLEKVGFKNLGVVTTKNPAILRSSTMPAIMLEVGSINNVEDNRLFDQKFDQIADAIAAGIYEGTTGNEWTSTLETEPKIEELHSSAINDKYLVQFSLFQEFENAEQFVNKIGEMGYPLRVVEKGVVYAVQVADIKSLSEAQDFELELKLLGYDTLLMPDLED